MQYQKLTQEQKQIRARRITVYAIASRIQDEYREQGRYLYRDKAIRMAWREIYSGRRSR